MLVQIRPDIMGYWMRLFDRLRYGEQLPEEIHEKMKKLGRLALYYEDLKATRTLINEDFLEILKTETAGLRNCLIKLSIEFVANSLMQ